jgi:nucleoside-diphosphate-sugar epimerase
MPAKNCRILVTGATGQIGSELVMGLREKYGGKNVVAMGHSRKPSGTVLSSGPFEYGDVSDRASIEKIIKKHGIDTVYHMAAMLSVSGEKNPQLAWNVNMNSLYYVLEIAREQKLSKIFWPSSIAVFGPTAPRNNTPQNTILIPGTMYGITKVAGELLCNYYFIKYGLDVRSIRYPGIISSETPPGGGTTDYAVEIFYEAIKNKKYTCFVTKDTVLPMMYMPDCLKATIDIMEEDSARIKTRTSYNVAGLSFSAGELAAEIAKYICDLTVEYKPDFRQKIADSWPMTIDDEVARNNWRWKPRYDLASMTKDMLEKLTKRHAEGKL